jgi:hypothetical protein
MDRRLVHALARVFFAGLTLAAILTQLADLVASGTLKSHISYFSYFTIDSNLIAAAVLLIGAARWRSEPSPTFDLVRGAAVVYVSVTGIVFTLLLSNTDVDTAIPWVNSVVHQLMPIVIVADWLLDPPAQRLTTRQGLLWLTFPFAWLAYTLVRGSLTGLYPYPFLDPANGGYQSVAVYIVAILVVMAIVCWLTVVLGNAAGGDRRRAPMPA